jgi:hypothetical protein
MLRKREENIFTQKGRQVHAITHYGHRFLACQRHTADPVVKPQQVAKRLQTSHTLALEGQVQRATHEEFVLQLLNLQRVSQRLLQPDEGIQRLNLQLAGRYFSFQHDGVPGEMM